MKTQKKKHLSIAHCAILLTLLIGVVSIFGGCRFFRGYAEGVSMPMQRYDKHAYRGFFRLIYEDFQSLNTDAMARNAVPWKVLAASVLHVRRQRNPKLAWSEDAFVQVMVKEYGFLRPKAVANWPKGLPQPPLSRPIGLVSGMVKRSMPSISFEVANTGCSTCHTGTTYDAQGMPTGKAWVGLPSTSINLEAYATDAYRGLKWASQHPKEAIAAIRRVFPKVSELELGSLGKYYLPPLAKRMQALSRSIDRFTPYSNGSPGLTNGAATVQHYLGMLRTDKFHHDQAAVVSMPDLGALRLKRSILIDGVYAPQGAKHYGPLSRTTPRGDKDRDGVAATVALVTISTLGVSDKVAVSNRILMRDVVDYLFDSYTSPAFPGRIDATKADQGHKIFQQRCQNCHGTYAPSAKHKGRWILQQFPNKPIPQAQVGSDALRWKMVSPKVLELFERTALGPYIDPKGAGGYVATPLVALWATAPYLHNGSVPTLWHLMNPKQRPKRFYVGGHRLDYKRMGIAGNVDAQGVYRYPKGYQPWSRPQLFDATKLGHTNLGHEKPFEGLSTTQKEALLEFLKRL